MGTNKIIFYSLCAGLVCGTIYLTVAFFSEDNTPEQSAPFASAPSSVTQNSATDESVETNLESEDSASHENSWNHLTDKEIDTTQVTQIIKKDASVENNVSVLRDLFMSGQDSEFEQKINDLIAQNPGVIEYVALKADFYFSKKDFPKTEEALRGVLDIQPDNVTIRTSLAETLLVQGKTDLALEEFDRVVSQNPRYYDGLNGMLNAYKKAGQYEEGVAQIQKMYEQDSKNPAVARVYAQILALKGDMQSRDEIIEQSVRANPYDPYILNSASEVSLRSGDKKRALQLGEQAFLYATTRRAKSKALDLMWASSMAIKDYSAAQQVIDRQRSLNYDPETILLNERQLKEARASQ